MRISGVSAAAAALANIKTRTAGSAEETTQTLKQADLRVRQQGESVSVTLSPADKLGIAPPTDSTPSIFAASPDTPTRATPELPRVAPSPLEQKTDQGAPRQVGGTGNAGNSTGPLADSNRPPETRQTEDQSQAATRQAGNAQAEKPDTRTNTAIAAYQRIFSL